MASGIADIADTQDTAAGRKNGLTYVGSENGFRIFEVGSGDYDFFVAATRGSVQ
jgi:hypothetical protein